MGEMKDTMDDNSSGIDIIDIISIGTLYHGGRWEKKYWSSSRGKDRHPYPVGYQAARTHYGIMSRMEIQEGDTGPLFVITASDGQSSSGQTPNIAWKKFQRACSSHVKSLRGKRLSANIDGVEFFGFKYIMVQRLLRQMVAAANQGTRVPTIDQNTHILNQSLMSGLSHDFPKHYTEDKGGEKRKISHTELIGENKVKKVRPQDDSNLSSFHRTKRDGDICASHGATANTVLNSGPTCCAVLRDSSAEEYLLHRSSSAAIDNPKPRLNERETMVNGKLCASLTVDMLCDPPLTPPKEKFSLSQDSDDALTAEGSPAQLSQEEVTCMSDPNIIYQDNDCDSGGEEITRSMLKLLLPQAFPSLGKARRTNKKGRLRRFSSTRNIPQRDHPKYSSVAEDEHILDGEGSISICQDPGQTKQVFEASKNVVLEFFNNACNDHTNLEQLADVPDSCDELDDNACVPDSCDELDDNAHVPDSYDELDDKENIPDSYEELNKNLYVPDSCDELDDNACVLDSSDELNDNAYVPDSCDELHDKKNIPDSYEEFNKKQCIPDSCDESDEKENIPVSIGVLANTDEKRVIQDCHVQASEGKEFPYTSYGERNIFAKSIDRDEDTIENSHFEIYPKNSGCGTMFSEHKERSNHYLMHRGRFILSSQQLNAPRNSNMGIGNVSSDELNGVCQSAQGKCVHLEAGLNLACVPNHNLNGKVLTCYEAGCSGKHDGLFREGTLNSTDKPQNSNHTVLQNKTPACASYGNFKEIPKFSCSDMAKNEELLMSENNVSFEAEILNHKQSVSIDESKMSAGQRASDAYYHSNLSMVTDCENKLIGSGNLIGFPSFSTVSYEELLMSEKNGSSKSETLHHKQSASVDDSNKYASPRDFNGCYSMLNMAAECGNKLNGFDRLIGHSWSDMVNNEELMLSEKNVSSKSETLHHKQSASLDESIKFAGWRDFDDCHSVGNSVTKRENNLSDFGKLIGHPGSDMVNNEELTTSAKNVNSKSETFHHAQSASADESTMSAGWRDFNDCYSMLNMATERENNLSGFRKPIRHPGSDMVNNRKLKTNDKNVSSKSETLHQTQLASLDESTNGFGKLIGRPGSDVNNEELMSDKNLSSKSETLNHNESACVDESTKSAGQRDFDDCYSKLSTGTKCEYKLSGFGKLIGHYAHPKPVLSVLICSKDNEAYICTSCGTSQDKQRTLFMYKLKIEGTNIGCPSFIGHSHMLLPHSECIGGRQIALDSSGMQFTPNGENLVLLNGMQVPCCRNGLMPCQCLECESHSPDENAVKIVHLKHGYVSVLAKLKTVCRVVCLLVCEPNHLVAVEANGAFRLWSMNATWRLATEEFIMPPAHCISPCAVELKQIPNCSHLVLGHNCFGEFGLWDILRHTLISRFFIPDVAIFRFIPVSLFRRNRKYNTFTSLSTKEHSSSLRNTTSTMLNLSNEEDVVISILIATCPDMKSSNQLMPDGFWRLCLLMNHKVFLKHTLDPRAVTIAASGDCGILGTSQGYVLVWDLSTGLELGSSLCFEDGRVQCLYTDTARSGLLAVADDKGNLLLYFGRHESLRLGKAYLKE